MNKKGKEKREMIYKVIILGDYDVGKRELLAKFAANQFEEKYSPTIGVSIFKTAIELKDYNVTVNLMFWDFARQLQFHTLYHPYFDGADGIVLVFDVTRSSTFSNINDWYNLVVEYGLSEIPKILIGNKAHIKGERRIILPMAELLCEELNAHYYETSSFTGYNVKEAFEKIAELIYRTKNLGESEKNEKLIIKPYQGELIETSDIIPSHEETKIPYMTKKIPEIPASNWPSPTRSWGSDSTNLTNLLARKICPKCGSAKIWIDQFDSRSYSIPIYYIFNSYTCIECRYKF
ncbi:MAG: GTP-binding protein [Candidatus Lokiarchaeota archaeon]|nr:GTP-binding protein [Candidatus Lokiarchaeota archaeon]